ncbi:MAG: hypothetical protein GF334_05700 [Candidatus Altiarchaeales archaeon]|nr:hypothetical protein [Candidatus Altiarchaeales archaeon]
MLNEEQVEITGNVTVLYVWNDTNFRVEMQYDGNEYMVLGRCSQITNPPLKLEDTLTAKGRMKLNRKTGKYHIWCDTATKVD